MNQGSRRKFRWVVVLLVFLTGLAGSGHFHDITFAQSPITNPDVSEAATDYDPLQINKTGIANYLETVKDLQRKREIPIRVFLPQSKDPAPVILFSHGLGGSRENNTYLGTHWSARGYVCVFLQHPGSDEQVWKDVKLGDRISAMKKAASNENLLLRVSDVSTVLDQLEVWNKKANHKLNGRMNLDRVGMCGHSFGAVTTQAVSGQNYLGSTKATDKRIKAACAMSPSVPRLGIAERAFGKVAVPWLLMTGTNDTSFITPTTVEDRLAVFKALPPGDKYELVLDKGEHSAFSERAMPNEQRTARNPNHHRAILAISTAFWDSYLKTNEDAQAAEAWLKGKKVQAVLESQDRWSMK